VPSCLFVLIAIYFFGFHRRRSEVWRKCSDTLPGRHIPVADHSHRVRDAPPEYVHGGRIQDGQSSPADHIAEPKLYGPAVGARAELAAVRTATPAAATATTATATTATALRPVLGHRPIRRRRTVARM